MGGLKDGLLCTRRHALGHPVVYGLLRGNVKRIHPHDYAENQRAGQVFKPGDGHCNKRNNRGQGKITPKELVRCLTEIEEEYNRAPARPGEEEAPEPNCQTYFFS